jgi:hypothetical protein
MTESKVKDQDARMIAREGFDRRLRDLVVRRQRRRAAAGPIAEAPPVEQAIDLGPPISQNGPLVSEMSPWFQRTVSVPAEFPKQRYPIVTRLQSDTWQKKSPLGKGVRVRTQGQSGRKQPGWKNF